MPFKVQVGPHQVAIHHGQTVLVSEPDGQINWPSEKGLYFFDTRVDQQLDYLRERRAVEPSRTAARSPTMPREPISPIAAFRHAGWRDSGAHLGLVVSRLINGGLHEDLDLTNNSMQRVRFQLEIALRCDFADIFEVKSNNIVRRGRITTDWSQTEQQLRTELPQRRFRPRRDNCSGAGRAERDLCQWPPQLRNQPRSGRSLALLLALRAGRRRAGPFRLRTSAPTDHQKTHHAETLSDWLTVRAEDPHQQRGVLPPLSSGARGHGGAAVARSPDTDHKVFLPAAGLPWFVAPFGRDSLIVSLQNILIYPDFARGSLDILGSLQAKVEDDYRDAEPGKILHEMRYGELAHFKLVPHTPYYGTADATPLYLITLHAAWRATGDLDAAASGISKPPRDACRGSIVTATATATDFRNIRPVRPPATRTWRGRTLETASSIRTARW